MNFGKTNGFTKLTMKREIALKFVLLQLNYNVFDMNSTIESNLLLDRLPQHLRQFIKPQDYSDYTYKPSSMALCDAQKCRLFIESGA
jgi:hypothetical protein